MGEWISGTFQDPDAANRAVEDLIGLGYPRESISVLVSERTRQRYLGDGPGDATHGGRMQRGAAAGGAIGGGLGLLLGAAAIVSTGGVAAPLVAGPLAAVLVAGAASAGAGSVIGAVAGGGIASEEASRMERDAAEGAIVLAVEARPENADRVREILAGHVAGARSGGAPPDRHTSSG